MILSGFCASFAADADYVTLFDGVTTFAPVLGQFRCASVCAAFRMTEKRITFRRTYRFAMLNSF